MGDLARGCRACGEGLVRARVEAPVSVCRSCFRSASCQEATSFHFGELGHSMHCKDLASTEPSGRIERIFLRACGCWCDSPPLQLEIPPCKQPHVASCHPALLLHCTAECVPAPLSPPPPPPSPLPDSPSPQPGGSTAPQGNCPLGEAGYSHWGWGANAGRCCRLANNTDCPAGQAWVNGTLLLLAAPSPEPQPPSPPPADGSNTSSPPPSPTAPTQPPPPPALGTCPLRGLGYSFWGWGANAGKCCRLANNTGCPSGQAWVNGVLTLTQPAAGQTQKG